MFGRRKARPDKPRSRRVRVLSERLDEAQDLHRLAADPLLNAVTADRFRVSITRTMWCFLALGLGFTTTGVHDFLAGHLTPADPLWWGAWLAEPALAGILVTLLRWEAAMLSHGMQVGQKPVTHLKRLLLTATLVANVWAGLAPSHGEVSKGMVFFHLVIPLVVFLLAEVMPIIQQQCTRVRDQALITEPARQPASPKPAPPARSPTESDPGPVAPAPASPPSPASAAEVRVLGKLPVSLRDTVTALATAAHEQGRPVTAAEITQRVALPDPMVTALVDELNTRINGHPITA